MHIQWFASLVALYSVTTFAGEPSQEPLLAIEAGMHTALIGASSVTNDGSLLLTLSSDKTARLWELPSGRLLRVMRPPVGKGDEGKLGAGALSSDRALAAIGGSTGFEWDRSACVYLFDTTNGRLLRRLTGLPDVVMDIAFSENGRYLAAVLHGGHGLRVWETNDWREIGHDSEYGDNRSDSVDWHGDNRLVTTCWDGTLRLYEVRNRKVQLLRRESFDRSHPSCARFSPTGRQIAVGFFDKSIPVVVVDGTTLARRLVPASGGARLGNFRQVEWSRDGGTLAAGGTWHTGGMVEGKELETALCIWPQSGRGQPRNCPAAKDLVTSLHSLPNGAMLFTTADPAWGLIDAGDGRTLPGKSPIASYAGLSDDFRISADGTELAFAYERYGGIRSMFSLTKGRINISPERENIINMHGPRLSGLRIRDWFNHFQPQLDGKPLELDNLEPSRSIAISGDASSFLLGAEFSIRRFTANGQEQWKKSAPGAAWAVNLTPDDQLAVAAFGDGTIRWYRASDGAELLAFFPHADRTRWITWTPEGYYAASAGAEDLVGWHLNRGKDQAADFFPASRFRALYYRPDVIQRVLKTRDTAEALRQANATLGRSPADPEGISEVISWLSPPIVELASGGVLGKVTAFKGAPSVAVRYRVRQTGRQRPTTVSVRFNGRPVDVTAPLPAEGEEAEVDVPLPEGVEGEVSISAEYKFGVSEAAILRVRRESGSPPARKPDLYVIACGVAHLQANEAPQDGTDASVRKQGVRKDAEGRLSFDDLLFAGHDARKFAGLFGGQEGKAYAHVIPTVLVDKQATTAAIVGALNDVKRKARGGDVVVVFFSGHGHFIPDPGFLLITHDTNPQNLAGTALTGQELARRLAEIRGSVVLALDTCYSGAALEGDKRVRAVTGPGDLTGFVNQLSSSEQSVVVISSSAENQSSFEDDEEKQGVFTKAVAEGFAGGAVQNGKITCASLQKWIIERVPVLAKKVDPKAEQYPACIMPRGVPDFALAKP